MITIERFDDPQKFGQRVSPFLLENEAQNCFLLGQIAQLTSPTDTILLAMMDGDTVVGAANRSPPDWPLMMTDTPPEACAALAQYLHEHRIFIRGVNAPPVASRAVAESWVKLTNSQAHEEMALGIFELDRVTPPPLTEGSFRQAGTDDLEALHQLLHEFGRELNEPLPDDRAATLKRIEGGRSFFWEVDGRIVTTAGWAGRTPNGVRINCVYTPPPHRRRGYASACVAALSQHLLDTGHKFVFLYTDLANPTSNRIYQQIGYRRIGGSLKIVFR